MEETLKSYLRNSVKQKVHEERTKGVSKNEEDLKVRIMLVWNNCMTNKDKKSVTT